MDDYTNCEFSFCGIDNIHAVTNVFNKLFEIAQNPLALGNNETFVSMVHDSGYLQFIEIIFLGVNKALNSILNLKQNVLVHCSDGWDRTG